MDLIVFSIRNNHYGISLDRLERVVSIPKITPIPGSGKEIDGLISYDDKTVKIYDLRAMVHYPTYKEDLDVLFVDLKKQHSAWVNALREAVETGQPFSKTTDHHACNLGKWIDDFICYDDHIEMILGFINDWHKKLHQSAIGILQLRESDPDAAMKLIETKVNDIYERTMGYLNEFVEEMDTIANSIQKLLIYVDEKEKYALKIDKVLDIIHIQAQDLLPADNVRETPNRLHVSNVVKHHDMFIKYIEQIDFSK